MYEIRPLYSPKVDEVAATLDHALEVARRCSRGGFTYVVVLVEKGRRTTRALARRGEVFWSKPCRKCQGEGTACFDCNGSGIVAQERV